MSITDYGAFVELEPGVEGLIHVSEMSLDQEGQAPVASCSRSGQELECQVLEVDAKSKRISARPEAARARSLDALHREVPAGRQDRRQGPQHHRLRRLRRHRRGRRRHGPQERHLVDGQGQQPARPLQEGRRRRGHHPQHQPRREEGLARHQAALGRPVADHLQRVPAGQGRQDARSLSVVDYGVFVHVRDGVEGLIPQNDIVAAEGRGRQGEGARDRATRSRRRSPTSTRRSAASRCRCAWARRAGDRGAGRRPTPKPRAARVARRRRRRRRRGRGGRHHRELIKQKLGSKLAACAEKADKKDEDDRGREGEPRRRASSSCRSGCGPPGGWSYILGDRAGGLHLL